MTTLSDDTRTTARDQAAAGSATLAAFAAALFLSAFLLFGVQPMFTKMVMPVLGGTPAVWSVAMVFFQALLLGGYAYAHLLVSRLGPARAAFVHLGLMAAAGLTLPIAVAEGWGRPPAHGEAFWLLGLFTVSVGAPFFMVSANGPLLQGWFARTGHRQAADPYFLYGASNLGSFAALAAYPLLVEPGLTLRQQGISWTAGFVALGLLIALCAALAARGARQASVAAAAATQPAPGEVAIGWRLRLRWLALAFVPSGLLVAVTAHIATDIASAPLLWVVPLALFLLTFVVAFRDAPWIAAPATTRLLVWSTAFGILSFAVILPLWLSLPTHLGLFFLIAVSAHHELYRIRPAASRLTEFYMWMSLGGVLGGAFCGLLAPQIFSFVLEYPLLLLAGLLCRSDLAAAAWKNRREAMVLLAIAILSTTALVVAATAMGLGHALRLPLVAVLAGLTIAVWRRGERVVALASAAILAATFAQVYLQDLQTFRSFFGVHKVATTADGRFHLLMHGTTTHGAIRIREDDGRPVTGKPGLTTYFMEEGGIGQAIAATRAARGGQLDRVATIGLGSGTMACHVRPGETWTFLEIDAEVVRLAQNPAFFRFLRDCPPAPIPIVLGDARLTIADQPPGLDAIIVDAFSSDAIPAHLMTAEAIGLYLSRLDENGVIVAHISNRHLDLRRILARVAAVHGLVTYAIAEKLQEPFALRRRAPTVVAIMARRDSDLGTIATDPAWQKVAPDLSRRPWTDDFSNIIEAMLDRHR